jgi:hypothetical protein
MDVSPFAADRNRILAQSDGVSALPALTMGPFPAFAAFSIGAWPGERFAVLAVFSAGFLGKLLANCVDNSFHDFFSLFAKRRIPSDITGSFPQERMLA